MRRTDVTERQKKILAALVEEYIASAEPVGSKTVLERAGLKCSSATVRSELASLEKAGLLEQPHTSAGRIPTGAGYRLYVNELMDRRGLTEEETKRINEALASSAGRDLFQDAGRLASEETSYPALAVASPAKALITRFDLIYLDSRSFIIVLLMSDSTVKNKLVRLPFSFEEALVRRLNAAFNASFTGIGREAITPELIESTELGAGDTLGLASVIASFAAEALASGQRAEPVLMGSESLLKIPEFRDSDKAHRLMSYLSGSELAGLPSLPGSGDIKVLIGPENVAEELKDTSVVLASYDAGDNMRGVIGVVGPTRMDYSKVAAKLSYIAAGLSRLLAGRSMPPQGFGKLMIKGDDTPHEG
ncbi:MAG: heat-inducible transcription repressor HrcA [Oscillospiraceae bacterium]|nr:heat-inducible transcription repressor HrcA [Oscillospiraceae bacterium]